MKKSIKKFKIHHSNFIKQKFCLLNQKERQFNEGKKI